MEINTYSPSKFLTKPNKRNRFYLNDLEQSDDHSNQTRRKPLTNEDKIRINNLANRLRTLLKLPKAHRWVIYEWFYSSIDQPLFCYNKPNDFQLCLNDILPQLKTRNLRRFEWCQIRKLMGKPRRCSSAFLAEERETLKRKRDKLREIYLNSNIDNLDDYLDLPRSINLPLIVGSKCTVLFKKTHEGLFDATINAIDLKNGFYRVKFDKDDFGCENVYDFEVRSCEDAEQMPLIAFESKKNRPINLNNNNLNVKKLYDQHRLNEMIDDQFQQKHHFNQIKEENENSLNSTDAITSINSDESFVRFMNHCSMNSNNSTNSINSPNNQLINNQRFQSFNNRNESIINSIGNQSSSSSLSSFNQSDPLHNQLMDKEKDQIDNEMIGNYPLKFLASIINFYKLVNKKRNRLDELKRMNTQTEFLKTSSRNDKLSNEFRNEYATIILDLERIKDNLNMNLEKIDAFCKELKLIPKQKSNSNDNLLENDFIKRNLFDQNLDQNSTNLITNLIGLLLMIKNFDTDDATSLQFKIKTIKQALHHRNIHCFENNVELHFNNLLFNYDLDKMMTNRLDAFHNDHL